MIHLELEPELEARLAVEAEARGLQLDIYIQTIVAMRPSELFSKQRVSEAIDNIFELRKGNQLGGVSIKELVHEGHCY